MRVIVTGGGTGGHIYPALAIARGLLAEDTSTQILYVGTRNGMEARLVPDSGLPFAGISGQGLPRKIGIETLKAAGKSLRALWETKRILQQFHPDLVIGTGGYVSGPVVLTAALFGIPTMLHEQNALPGITNRILALFVRKVLVTFPESTAYFGAKKKVVNVGLPVRTEIGQISRSEGSAYFGLHPENKTILVTGGSRGALTINQAMITVLKHLAAWPEIQVIWATGQQTYGQITGKLKTEIADWQRPQWKITGYLEAVPQALACADLYIGRAGAASLAEVAICGKAAILIPYPYAAGNHQEYNARAFVQAGAAKMILDKDLDGEKLWQLIKELLINNSVRAGMAAAAGNLAQPEALKMIVDLCRETAWR
ncbi:MAG TPA: undecaprenyldiphospho-muramoylpentapeptide beta-N-acetylglucosaminyltransferase [Desulfitobacteriaceae bacterium]|nr:undecaprenyldiphospho-muramoylpentapeptide beta-N-acetylglucosaminyltransferase [Desulfitobacteriaceae bacterium]